MSHWFGARCFHREKETVSVRRSALRTGEGSVYTASWKASIVGNSDYGLESMQLRHGGHGWWRSWAESRASGWLRGSASARTDLGHLAHSVSRDANNSGPPHRKSRGKSELEAVITQLITGWSDPTEVGGKTLWVVSCFPIRKELWDALREALSWNGKKRQVIKEYGGFGWNGGFH